jgi:SAM-dependent methyltransferase
MDDSEARTGFFYQVFEAMPRQGPGSDAATRWALDRLRARLPATPRVLDIGCGSGAQTRVLAESLRGEIVALDNHRPFLARLQRMVDAAPPLSRVMPVCASLFAPPFPDGQFDLVWSEGAVYLMGLEPGLRAWRGLLRPGGLVALSDIAWLTARPRGEVEAFWQRECPGLTDLETVRARIEGCGYEPLGHFVLPPEAWEAGYYWPLEAELARLRTRHPRDPAAAAVCRDLSREIAMYRRAAGSLGYVFWVLRPR